MAVTVRSAARPVGTTRSSFRPFLTHVRRSRPMAAYVARTEQVAVSHHWVAALWRTNGLKPHRLGTFKLSRDPRLAAKVADVVGLYLE